MNHRRTVAPTGVRRARRARQETRRRTTGASIAVLASVGVITGSVAAVASDGGVAATFASASTNVESVTVAAITAPEAEIVTTTTSEEVVLEHGTVEQSDPSEFKGTETVVTEGSDGVALVSKIVTMVDGKASTDDPSVTVVLDEPVDQVVAVGTLTVPTVTSNPTGNRAIGAELAASMYGWSGGEWQCLDALWTRESGWNAAAHNSSSGAHGIPQALPGSKMASAGADWYSNPATQIKWGLGYIKNRYGSPCAAWGHSETVGWY